MGMTPQHFHTIPTPFLLSVINFAQCSPMACSQYSHDTALYSLACILHCSAIILQVQNQTADST